MEFEASVCNLERSYLSSIDNNKTALWLLSGKDTIPQSWGVEEPEVMGHRGDRPRDGFLDESGREMTLKMEVPVPSLTLSHSSKGKAFVKEDLAKAQYWSPGYQACSPTVLSRYV